MSTQQGGNIDLPAGLYNQAVPITITTNGSYNAGAGWSTLVQRTADMPTNYGVVNISATNTVLADMAFDGGVTTATGVLRSTITGPLQASFLKNTTIWVTGGTTNLTLSNLKIAHTGGYAIFLDARAGNITNVTIENCTFINNRPFLFGNTSGDENYGGWLGGIFYYNMSDGSNAYQLTNLLVKNCTFSRTSGNNFWGSANGFETPNGNIQVVDCFFEYTGLDAIEPSNVNNFLMKGNKIHAVGWVATDDTSTPLPKYDTGFGAVGVDCSSNVYNGSYEGNTITSITGYGMNLDGMFNANVTGNTIIQPLSTDPLYAADNIATAGVHGAAQEAVGIQTGNTYIKYGGQNLLISGNNIQNMGYCAISLPNLKFSKVMGNVIWHSGSAGAPPIEIACTPGYDDGVWTDGSGSVGTVADAAYYRSHDNTISENHITYGADTAAANFCIAEIDVVESGVTYTFKATDINRVFGNTCLGTNYGEFLKDANSGSFSGLEFQTNDASSTSADVTRLQREGSGATAALKIYALPAGGGGGQIAQLSDGQFLNVGDGADTGNISTGARGTSAWPDAILTSKLYADGFTVILGNTASGSTYEDADANLLDATYAIFRYNNASNVVEVSTSVSGGDRVWNQILTSSSGGSDVASLNGLTGSLSIAGVTNQTTVTASGSTVTVGFATNLSITGTASTASVVLTNGYYEALDSTSGGYYAGGNQFDVFKAPSGGIHVGLGATVDQALYPKTLSSAPNPPGSGYAGLGHNSGSTWWYYNPSTPGWSTVDFSAIGSGVTSLTGTSNEVICSGSTGAITLSLPQAIATGSTPQFAGLDLTGAITVANGSTSTNITYQNTNGNFQVDVGGAISCAGVITTTASVNVLGTATNSIQSAGGFKGTQLELTGTTNTQVFTIDNGYAGSAQGWYSPGTASTTVNIPSGGGTFGLGVAVGQAIYLADWSSTSGLNTPASGYTGFTWAGGSTFRYYNAGWQTVNFASVGGGVTSLSAGTGISVSGSTGAITVTNSGVYEVFSGTGVTVSSSTGAPTISIGQSVATTANVTFNAVAVSSSATNAVSVTGGVDCNALYASATNYNAISTNGGVVANGGFYVSTTQVINSSQQWVGGSVLSTAGIRGTGYQVVISGTTYTGASGPYTATWSGGFTVSGSTYHNIEWAGGLMLGFS
jgi:hypothetical protein